MDQQWQENLAFNREEPQAGPDSLVGKEKDPSYLRLQAATALLTYIVLKML